MVFAAMLQLTINTVAQDPDPEWAKRNTWSFDNFTKDTLSWSLFRETFIGVAPAPAADFDQLFYDELYKTKLASPGLCYGLDVMALLMMKNGGHLGYCHPPYVYTGGDGPPDDTTLEKAIEITHGNQINHGFLSFCLDVLALNKIRDGNYTFAKVQEYLAKNDPPVICISTSSGGIAGDEGHCIIPYATTQSGSTKKIWVYDPNRSWYKTGTDGQPWYTSHQNFITVNSTTGAWSFVMAGADSSYFGDPGSGGRIMAVPLSVAGKKDRLPQSLLAEGAYALNTILIYGNVIIEQITDTISRRQLLNDAGTDLEQRDEKRMNNLLGFVPLNGGRPTLPVRNNKAFFLRGSNPVDIHYKAYGKYRIGMIFHGKYYEVTGTGNGESLIFRPEDKFVQPAYTYHIRNSGERGKRAQRS
jgi:hypothetical protein